MFIEFQEKPVLDMYQLFLEFKIHLISFQLQILYGKRYIEQHFVKPNVFSHVANETVDRHILRTSTITAVTNAKMLEILHRNRCIQVQFKKICHRDTKN